MLITMHLINGLTGCPSRSYKVLKGLILVFPFIRLLERSYYRNFVPEVSYRSYFKC